MSSVEHLCLINNLPDEVLLYIFSLVPIKDILLAVRRICKRWLCLSTDETLWYNIDLSVFEGTSEFSDKIVNSAGVRNLLLSIHDQVKRLSFGSLPLEGDVYQLFGPFPMFEEIVTFNNLKCIDFSYSHVTPRNLRVALASNPDIEELILVCTTISFSQAMEEAVHLPLLKKFIFHDMHSWDTFLDHHQHTNRILNKLEAMKVPRHCQNLEWVELHSFWANLDDEVIQQFTKFCPKLSIFSITWSTFLTADAFQYIKPDVQQISELKLFDRQDRGPYLHFVLPKFPHLCHLTISGHDISQQDCSAIADCCPNLKELVLDANNSKEYSGMFRALIRLENSLNAHGLVKIAQKCKQIRKLHVPDSKITDASLEYLSQNCPDLEDINFMGCSLLSDKALIILAENSKNLKYINLREVEILPNRIINLLQGCMKLEEVFFDSKNEFSELVSSTDESLENSLVDSSIHSKKEEIPYIDISVSTDSLTVSRERQCDNCTLHSTDQTNCSTINEASHQFEIPYTHSPLKKLSLLQSTIGCNIFMSIFRFCPDLTHVILDACTNLTDESATVLVKSCPRLRYLSMSSHPQGCLVGDQTLFEITRCSMYLETLNVLFNATISSCGVLSILKTLPQKLRHMKSFSLCAGEGYKCSLHEILCSAMPFLTETCKQKLACMKPIGYSVLHLDFKKRSMLTNL